MASSPSSGYFPVCATPRRAVPPGFGAPFIPGSNLKRKPSRHEYQEKQVRMEEMQDSGPHSQVDKTVATEDSPAFSLDGRYEDTKSKSASPECAQLPQKDRAEYLEADKFPFPEDFSDGGRGQKRDFPTSQDQPYDTREMKNTYQQVLPEGPSVLITTSLENQAALRHQARRNRRNGVSSLDWEIHTKYGTTLSERPILEARNRAVWLGSTAPAEEESASTRRNALCEATDQASVKPRTAARVLLKRL